MSEDITVLKDRLIRSHVPGELLKLFLYKFRPNDIFFILSSNFFIGVNILRIILQQLALHAKKATTVQVQLKAKVTRYK